MEQGRRACWKGAEALAPTGPFRGYRDPTPSTTSSGRQGPAASQTRQATSLRLWLYGRCRARGLFKEGVGGVSGNESWARLPRGRGLGCRQASGPSGRLEPGKTARCGLVPTQSTAGPEDPGPERPLPRLHPLSKPPPPPHTLLSAPCMPRPSRPANLFFPIAARACFSLHLFLTPSPALLKPLRPAFLLLPLPLPFLPSLTSRWFPPYSVPAPSPLTCHFCPTLAHQAPFPCLVS